MSGSEIFLIVWIAFLVCFALGMLIASKVRDRNRRNEYTRRALKNFVKELGFGLHECRSGDGEIYIEGYGDGADRSLQPVKSRALDTVESSVSRLEVRLIALENFLGIEYCPGGIEEVDVEPHYHQVAKPKAKK